MVDGLGYWKCSHRVVEGYLRGFEGPEPERPPGDHFEFVVQALDGAA